jgi:hypothetical protein
MHIIPLRLTNLRDRPYGILLPLEANLDPPNRKHAIENWRLHAQHGLTVQRCSCPVVRAANGALHAALGAREKEADGWASSEKECCRHVACLLLATHTTDEKETVESLTSINNSKETLLPWLRMLAPLHQRGNRWIRRRIIRHTFLIHITVMPRQRTRIWRPPHASQPPAEDLPFNGVDIHVALEPKEPALLPPELTKIEQTE